MAEQHHFQAEIQQLLDLVVNSLYTDKEIFIRELISNAADACEKLRFNQSSGFTPHQPELALGIKVTTNDADGTVTVEDTGLGMTRDEMVKNLGTIAHSGTKAFVKQATGETKPDLGLIGQFGVGFYSAFMVASKVAVHSRSADPSAAGHIWTSDGKGGFEIEAAEGLQRGTRIVLTLKEDARNFSKSEILERIIRRYSNFVPFPVELNGRHLNTVQAIWTRSKNEIKEEDYQEFYKYLSHDSQAPILRLHFSADAPIALQTLLFVPSHNVEALGLSRVESEVNLYCKKVLIQARAKGLLPEWLRFLRGVVDSEDIPLNISRETMQDSALVQKLNTVITRRFLKHLEETAEKDPETYDTFYTEYARFLKEGVTSDHANREALGRLLRYESSATEPGKRTSLKDYVSRMREEQKEIYCLLAPNREAALASPYYEAFATRNFEVLFLFDSWDEFVMDHLMRFDGKEIQHAEKANIQADKPADGTLSEEEAKALAEWLKQVLADRVNEVRPSKRLVASPAVVVDGDPSMTHSMRRIFKAMKREGMPEPSAALDLEFNPAHTVIRRLAIARTSDPALATQVAEQLLDNARVAAGLLEDPRSMVARLNSLLERVLPGA